MRMDTDTILLNVTQTFTKQSLEEMYEDHSPGIFRYAYRLLGDQDLAEECVSESFSRFLQAVKRGKEPRENSKAYLYRIAHNWITDYYRSKTPPSLPLDPELRSDPADEPHQVVSDEMELQQVRSALALLTPDQRQVIMLKYLEEWENEEIAKALNKPVGAVKSLQHRAIESLRRLLH